MGRFDAATLKPATLVGLLFIATGSGSGFSASFDCSKATTEVEKVICAHAELSKLDEQMAAAYRVVLKREQNQEAIRREQWAWLRARDEGCGTKVACLRDLYADRLAHLTRSDEEDEPNERSYEVPDRYGPFIILFGSKSELCRKYQRVLYAIDAQVFAKPRNPAADPLFRARQIPAQFSEFSQPAWQEIDPRAYLDLTVEVAERMNNAQNWADLYASIPSEQRAHARRATEDGVLVNYRYKHDKWYLGRADIDNDGHPEHLIKFRRGRSPESARFAVPIMVLTPSGTTADVAKTRQLLLLTPASTYVPTHSFDVFRYRDKTYVDRWEAATDYPDFGTEDNAASVYLHETQATALVCRIWRAVRPYGKKR